MSGVLVAAAVAVNRDDARDAARRELSKPEYHRDDPSLIERVAEWIRDQLTSFWDTVGNATPGGAFGILVLVLLVALIVVAIVVKVGGVRRTATADGPLFAGRVRSAADHRAEAEAAASSGRFDLAVRERLRAIARELETRGLLDPRPGRTADELASDGGLALPQLAGELRSAARVFDDVWYGGRTATAESYAVVRAADEHVRVARLSPSVTP